MSKYTTEVRFICETASGLGESKGFTDVDTIITNAIPKIFNFSFPIFDENYRTILEKKILKHFYTREICEETAGLWKLRLDTKLNEIMPYYNKLYKSEMLEFNPLYTANLTRTKKTDYDSNRNINNNGTVNSTSNNNNVSVELYSDTPQGALTGIENETYLTNARKTTDNGNSSSSTTNSDSGTDALNSTEDYLETVIGFEGGSASDLLIKYRDTFLNIDMMIIEDLETLFFQLW
nr:MAG TPA: Lower collar protein [Caudoviricetes sp.]